MYDYLTPLPPLTHTSKTSFNIELATEYVSPIVFSLITVWLFCLTSLQDFIHLITTRRKLT